MIKKNRKKTGPAYIWEQPRELPDLSGAPIIALDTETCDEGINNKLGPGGVLGMGYLLGISVAVRGMSWYIPVRHPDTDNFDIKKVRKWANDQFKNPTQPKVGANILYDLEWLRVEGIEVKGLCHDVQDNESLLDEQRGRYNLASLMEQYLGDKYHKLTGEQEKLAREYLGDFSGDVRAHLYKLPAYLVGAYAEMDAIGTLLVWEEQQAHLRAEELLDVVNLETRLKPLLLDMRFQGTRIDLERVEQVGESLKKRIASGHKKLKKLVGRDINVSARTDLIALFDAAGYRYPKTAKGNPSFNKAVLNSLDNPISRMIIDIRKDEHLHRTFIEGMLKKHTTSKGRIYTQFNQLKSDEYGTVSGRFSSSNPNLQQVPAIDEEQGKLIRTLFIPEDGEEWWKTDWSQIEYRLFVHFAALDGLPGSEKAVKKYCEDPATDYHEWCAELLNLPRRQAKNLNFGFIYGMGKKKLAESLGVDPVSARQIFNSYHEQIPFAKRLAENVARVARRRGYVKTILGRRSRFKLYEPANWSYGEERPTALPYDKAVEEYGKHVVVAQTHKALNRVIQGSAADMMKVAMVNAYEERLFSKKCLGIPSLTVHDELDGSKRRDRAANEAYSRLIEIMETCVPLQIPVMVDAKVGPNWWDVVPYARNTK